MTRSIGSLAAAAAIVCACCAVEPATAAQTGYAVAINIPLTNNNAVENPKRKPLIIVARCNATNGNKDLEGWVGKNSPATLQDMVASGSGNGRQSITIVVPWQWYYRINVTVPPGGVCSATAWWSDTD
jgi:hypothetical protein